MKNYEFEIINTIELNMKTEEELVALFNDKLATLFVLYEKLALRG